MPTLFTIGYQDKTPVELVAFLKRNRVGRILDVRRDPVSRKHGFNKRQLQATLKSAGIEYLHLPELGIPKPVRERTIKNGDMQAFRRYARQRAYRYAHRVVELARSQSGRDCLLCLESDPTQCHRGIISQYIATTWGHRIKHL